MPYINSLFDRTLRCIRIDFTLAFTIHKMAKVWYDDDDLRSSDICRWYSATSDICEIKSGP